MKLILFLNTLGKSKQSSSVIVLPKITKEYDILNNTSTTNEEVAGLNNEDDDVNENVIHLSLKVIFICVSCLWS